jgi:phage protein D
LPPTGAPINVSLGWEKTGVQKTFTGFIDAPRSHGSRSTGHMLTISATSTDPGSGIKTTVNMHKDDATFEDAAKAFGKAAGLDVSVASDVAPGKQQYHYMSNESFMTWGARMARQLGLNFKISGTQAAFTSKNSSESVSGQQLATVTAQVGKNMIEWHLMPIYSRPPYQNYAARYYDPKKAQWLTQILPAKFQGSGDVFGTRGRP